MIIASVDIAENGMIPIEHVFSGMGCGGGNVAPILSWHEAPSATQSFALTVYDPDAPTGSGWWHWVVYNLPSGARSNDAVQRARNAATLPGGERQALNDFGTYSYGGPCPPLGNPPHRYEFTVHALKIPSIDLPANATPATVRLMIHANTLTSATITARFGR